MQQRRRGGGGIAAAALLLAALAAAALVNGAAASVDATASPKVAEPPKVSPTGTDAGAAEREAAGTMSSPAFKGRAAAGERYEFQAEVNRLMDILVHSLYSNRDVFLRELISNASDALDKLRFLALTDKSALGGGEGEGGDAAGAAPPGDMEIRIWADKPGRALYVRDRGVGMTRDELVKNLGTIAKSGTSAFLEQMQKGGDVNLIGQFGVGFYSVYLVADWVEVVTKAAAPGAKQYVWSSGADGSFSVAEDDGSGAHGDLGRGTLIKIHLKEDAEEYADQSKLKGLVATYSEFINFPIYLQTTNEKDVPVDEEAPAAADKKADDDKKADADDDDDVVDDDDDDDKAAPAKKTERRNVTEWEHLNDVKPIWLRAPADVTPAEHTAFYKAVSKDWEEPLSTVHFKAEGDVEFRALLYVPKRAPYDFYENVQRPKASAGAKKDVPGMAPSPGLKLYVRRVFVSDDADELLPRYLSFLRGVVDSDSLPLNVNREVLQAHGALKTIRKKLVRKALDAVKRLADDEAACKAADESKGGDDEADAAKPPAEACGRFATFYKEFGRALKLGLLEDDGNRGRLARLLRFHSSKVNPEGGDADAALTSLPEYVARMPEGQKAVYWVAGLTLDEARRSPFVERLVADGTEVLYLTDVLDEYVMAQLPEFEDLKLVNVAKEDPDTAGKPKDEAKAAKAAQKALRDAFKPLTGWWKEQLKERVSAVKVSRRLASTPCVVVASKWGQSANMERIMRASAFNDPSRAAMMRGQRSLEVNPDHPLIAALRDRVAADKDDAAAARTAALLYEAALIESGFEPDDPKAFTRQMYELVGEKLLGVELPGATTAGGAAKQQAAAAGDNSEDGDEDGPSEAKASGKAAAAGDDIDDDDDDAAGAPDKSEL